MEQLGSMMKTGMSSSGFFKKLKEIQVLTLFSYIHRSLLQAMMYLGNVYYDTSTHLGVDNFNGVFLDSARYFCYIPRREIDTLMEKFEPLWRKYFRVSPSKAYKEPELESFAELAMYSLRHRVKALDEHFRLDLLLKEIYYNNV